MQQTNHDIAVAGGGLGGLVSAILCAQGGKSVILLESRNELGGRAMTRENEEFRFNLGPHALYRDGATVAVMRGMGIALPGGVPQVDEGRGDRAPGKQRRARRLVYSIVRGNTRYRMPATALSLITTGAFSLSGKMQLGRLMAALPTLDPAPLMGVTVAEWLDELNLAADARQMIEALVRLTTYVHAPGLLCAGVALQQIQMALGRGVLYLDGGWQRMIEALRHLALELGVSIRTGAGVSEIARDRGIWRVRSSKGTEHRAGAVILAIPPAKVSALLGPWSRNRIHGHISDLVAARASCLDIGLTRLPRSKTPFALGLDRPDYLSVHSRYARLAAPGHALIHVARYLAPGQGGADVAELESLLDLMQPGWRKSQAARRFYPTLTVAHGIPLARDRGRRAPVRVPDLPGLYVVGDWVGDAGMLADATCASAREAAGYAASAAVAELAA